MFETGGLENVNFIQDEQVIMNYQTFSKLMVVHFSDIAANVF